MSAINNTTKGGNDMRARLTKLAAALAAVSVLAFGGASLAGAATSPPSPPAVTQTEPGVPESGAAEQAVPESGAESAISDGPGGHADDPANSSADNQFQGEQ
jgi:hypothetical protein